jgi:hypothetical protein
MTVRSSEATGPRLFPWEPVIVSPGEPVMRVPDAAEGFGVRASCPVSVGWGPTSGRGKYRNQAYGPARATRNGPSTKR